MLPLLAGASTIGVLIVPLVVKVLLALGIGYATFTGVTAGMDVMYAYIVDQTNALPADMLAMFGVMNLDKYITMIFSAYSARLTIVGLTSAGVMNKLQIKGLPSA